MTKFQPIYENPEHPSSVFAPRPKMGDVFNDLVDWTGIDLLCVDTQNIPALHWFDDHPLIRFMGRLGYQVSLRAMPGREESRLSPRTDSEKDWFEAYFSPFNRVAYSCEYREWGWFISEAIYRAAHRALLVHRAEQDAVTGPVSVRIEPARLLVGE